MENEQEKKNKKIRKQLFDTWKGCGKTIASDEGTCNYCGEYIKCDDCKSKIDKLFGEFKEELICKKCNVYLDNLPEVSRHAMKFKHYEFYNPKNKLTLGII